MATNPKSKLTLGIVLVLGAGVCAGAAVYLMGDVNMRNQKKIAQLEVQLTNLMNEKAEKNLKGADAQRLRGPQVTLEKLVDKASGNYSQQEREQKEGLLWIDRDAKTYMVTLGALNGLKKGSQLSIYQGEKQVDVVTVQSVYDVIAYVKPLRRGLEDFAECY